jgi:DNA-binding CsgD family transcriptional regulator
MIAERQSTEDDPTHWRDADAAVELHTLGVVALAADEASRAAGLLGEAAAWAGGVSADPAIARRLPADLIESLGRLGDARALRDHAHALQERGRRTASQRVLGWAAHALALAAGGEGDPDAAVFELKLALRCAELVGDPFELARVLVTLGQSERRLRRRRAARAHFGRAITLFSACGAEAWALRTSVELARASGDRDQGDGLTATERRVCERAAAGRSNAEIGAELYISRRTVESNLARAYAKLRIRSRAQLGIALFRYGGAGDPSGSPAMDPGRAVRSALAVLRPVRGYVPSSEPLQAAS